MLLLPLEIITNLIIVMIGSPLLFWLGRSSPAPRGEMVVDPEFIDDDDPGVDVDDVRSS